MYKAVFLDMDGTLLRSDHSVSEETIRKIRSLTAGGVLVVLVSARPLGAVLPTFRNLGLPEQTPLITLNGSYVVQSGEPILDVRIDLETTATVTREVRPYNATIAYYLQREWFSEVRDAWTDHEQKIMDTPVQVEPIDSMIGLFSAFARASASGPHAYQSTGLNACCRRYGLCSLINRFGLRPD